MTTFTVQRSAGAVSADQRRAILEDPGFGRHFTDHMVSIRYHDQRGWYEPSVVPLRPDLAGPGDQLHPLRAVDLRGMKAYRHADGHIRTFRPLRNAHRFRSSARRLAMPEMPAELFIESLVQLAAVDGDWVPSDPEKSLYLRPFMFSTEVGLGSSPPMSTSTCSSPRRPAPTSRAGWLRCRWLTPTTCGLRSAVPARPNARQLCSVADRAGRGESARLRPGGLARRQGTPVGRGDGGMNLFFVFGTGDSARLITPPLTGSLLPGCDPRFDPDHGSARPRDPGVGGADQRRPVEGRM